MVAAGTPPPLPAPGTVTAIRGPALSFRGDPFAADLDAVTLHEPDAIIVMADGKIVRFGPAAAMGPPAPPGLDVADYGRDSLILPGFIDCHVHYPQTQIIGSYGRQLLDWLNKYTFV